jgi:hypothetical protein
VAISTQSTLRASAHSGGCWVLALLGWRHPHSPPARRPISTYSPPYEQWLVGMGWMLVVHRRLGGDAAVSTRSALQADDLAVMGGGCWDTVSLSSSLATVAVASPTLVGVGAVSFGVVVWPWCSPPRRSLLEPAIHPTSSCSQRRGWSRVLWFPW